MSPGLPDNDDRWKERGDKAYDDFTDRPRRTIAKWFIILMAIIIGLAIVFGIISWVGSWGGEVKRITGPENTREQAITLRDDYKSLEATAGNVCDAEKGAEDPDPNDPQIVGGDPAFQYKATYRRIKADYDRRMSNAFEAGWVRKYPFLNDLPQTAPTLDEMKEQVC